MHKKALVLILVSQLVVLSVAGVQSASGSETLYPLASGIYVRSPSNRTYSLDSLLPLNASVTALVASNIHVSMLYSLDGMSNNTLPTVTRSRENSFLATIIGAADLPVLSYSLHYVTVYVKLTVYDAYMAGVHYDEYVHWDNSTVYFTISDTVTPDELIPTVISDLSIENKTYNSTKLLLSFNIDKTASWIGYCLDNQGNRTIAGLYDINRWGNHLNQTLTGLTEGSHQLTVYANNTAGKTGASETVYFTIRNNSEQHIPEFPSWTVLPLLITATLAALIYRKRLHKTSN